MKTNETKTFEEIRAKTICIAKNYQRHGFKKGDVIYFTTNNTSDIVPLFVAALCLGCPIAMKQPEHMKAECLHYLKVTKPNFVFCDLDYYSQLKECLSELGNDVKIFTFSGQMGDSIPVENLFEIIEPDLNFMYALVQFSLLYNVYFLYMDNYILL